MYHQRFKSIDQRFSEKFTTGPKCWEWIISKNGKHPEFWDGERNVKASRFAYQRHYGPFDQRLHVCHHCDNPRCVRPQHLFLGTHDANMADKAAKRRSHRPIGELNGRAKFTLKKANRVRALYAAGGVSQAKLAARFGISPTGISAIVRGVIWKND